MNPSLESSLEVIEAKLWLLLVTRMEKSLASAVANAQDELANVAANDGGHLNRVSPLAARLAATVGRIDAELAAIEKIGVGAPARLNRRSTSGHGSDTHRQSVEQKRGRGRPRKAVEQSPQVGHSTTTAVAGPNEEKSA